MAGTFRDYAVLRDARLDAEGRAALEVFSQAHAFGNALLDARKNRGLSQRALEARSGVAQADISRIERGRTLPTLPTLLRLLHALDAHLVLELEGEKPSTDAGAATSS